MKIEKNIKNAYENVPVPERSRVLPQEALETGKTRKSGARRYWRTAVAALLVICVMAAGIVTAVKLGGGGISDKNENGGEPSYSDGVIGGRPSAEINGDLSYAGIAPSSSGSKGYYREDYAYEVAPSGDLEYHSDDGYIGGEYGCEPYAGHPDGSQYQFRAGTLTAGETRDISDLETWIKRFEDDEWRMYTLKRGLYAYNVFEVRVTNGDSAVYGETVELYTADGSKKLFAAKTDITGRAYIVFADKDSQSVGLVKACGKELQVTSGDAGKSFVIETDPEHVPANELDLMLMIDTTGSMGDELEYLKAELLDMVSRVAQNGETLSIRVSVNFYRDEGDEYVVKYYDFRTDINECLEQIRTQYASGGGDYPEAVHTALENAVNGHGWRENAIKLCFFVLDAPPHDESEIQGINSQITGSLASAAEKGVRIIPVASSGVDKDTEVLLRSFAVMTGGTYIFLTDHSGIGNPHLDPTVEEYTVEALNECMIRVICEYCGLEYTAPVPAEQSSAPQQ